MWADDLDIVAESAGEGAELQASDLEGSCLMACQVECQTACMVVAQLVPEVLER